MGFFASMGSSTFGLGLCYNMHTVLLRLLKEDPNETLFKILYGQVITRFSGVGRIYLPMVLRRRESSAIFKVNYLIH